MPRLLKSEHRTLHPAELLFLIVLDEHRGRDPLMLRAAERRMLPFPADESFVAAQGYVEQGKLPNGKPVKGAWSITDLGRTAIHTHMRAAIAEAESKLAEVKAKGLPEEAVKSAQEMIQRLKAKQPGYPPLPGQDDADDAKSGGDADGWDEWSQDRHKGEKEETAPPATTAPKGNGKKSLAERGGNPANASPQRPAALARNKPVTPVVSRTGRPKPRRADADAGDDESNT